MELFRSMFYTSLGRLLMVDLGEDEEKFDAFMIPLTQSFESLGQVLLNSGSSKLTTFDYKTHLKLPFNSTIFTGLNYHLFRRYVQIVSTVGTTLCDQG